MNNFKRDGMEIYSTIEYNRNKRKKESYKKIIENINDLRINGER